MKKKLIYGLLSFSLLGMVACKKELLKDNTEKTEKLVLNDVRSENNVLIFKNTEQLNKKLFELSEMSHAERIEWEESIGFESLFSLHTRLNDIEVERIEDFFKGVDPDLTVAEYESMGLNYQPSDLYKKYVKKGIINRVTEDDGSYSTELSIENKAFLFVLSEEMKFKVADLLYSFDNHSLRVIDEKSGKVVHEENFSENQKGNGDYNFYKGIYGSSGWITDPARGSKFRYRSFMRFASNYTTNILNQSYYWYARAERKRFGNWSTRNGYLPIWGFYANWKYSYEISVNGAYPTTVTSSSSNNVLPAPSSPYSLSGLNTNYTVRYLQPNGFFSKSSGGGYVFADNVQIYNDSYSSSFTGGSSGYSYSLY